MGGGPAGAIRPGFSLSYSTSFVLAVLECAQHQSSPDEPAGRPLPSFPLCAAFERGDRSRM